MPKRVQLKAKKGHPKKRKPRLASTILTRKLTHRFCRLLMEGLPADGCCDFLGIASSTFWTWKRRGEGYLNGGMSPPEDRIYGYFVSKFKVALAKYRLGLIRNLHRKGNNYWVRDVTVLERRDRSSFSRNEQAGGADEAFDPDERFV